MVTVMVNTLDGGASADVINDDINCGDDGDDDIHDDDDVDDVMMTIVLIIIIFIIIKALFLIIREGYEYADICTLDSTIWISYYYIMYNWPTKLWREFGYCLWRHIAWYTVTSLNENVFRVTVHSWR